MGNRSSPQLIRGGNPNVWLNNRYAKNSQFGRLYFQNYLIGVLFFEFLNRNIFYRFIGNPICRGFSPSTFAVFKEKISKIAPLPPIKRRHQISFYTLQLANKTTFSLNFIKVFNNPTNVTDLKLQFMFRLKYYYSSIMCVTKITNTNSLL